MVSVRLLPMGERAVLAEVESLADVLALHAALRVSRPPGVVDLVPAARTLLVQLDPEVLTLLQARAWVDQVASGAAPGAEADAAPGAAPGAAATPGARTHELDVRYDGPDLGALAAALGRTPAEVIARHTAAHWRVAFTGFAPGFGYLVSPAWPFDVPRLGSPRTAVPAGALGLAAEFSGIYPRETPGGWQLIGTTTARMFDPLAAEPALLAPGDAVRFRAVDA